jgi:hypothetical protein
METVHFESVLDITVPTLDPKDGAIVLRLHNDHLPTCPMPAHPWKPILIRILLRTLPTLIRRIVKTISHP